MNRPLQQLIEALREELQQCGEMLAHLEEPLRLPSARASDATWSAQTIADPLLAAREAREFSWRQLAWAVQLPQAVSTDELIPSLPPDHQPLVDALVVENADLWRRLHERLQQEVSWLHRARETSRQCLDLISLPDAAAEPTRPLRVAAA